MRSSATRPSLFNTTSGYIIKDHQNKSLQVRIRENENLTVVDGVKDIMMNWKKCLTHDNTRKRVKLQMIFYQAIFIDERIWKNPMRADLC